MTLKPLEADKRMDIREILDGLEDYKSRFVPGIGVKRGISSISTESSPTTKLPNR